MPGSRRAGSKKPTGKPAKKAAARRPAPKPSKPAAKRPAAKRPAAAKPPAPPSAADRRRALKVLDLLEARYPDARCMLDPRDPFQLLVATILAAQCTDERVNMTTPALFARFPTPEAMAAADIGELEELVKSTGFFRNKARSIKGAAAELARRFPGRFPDTMEELVTLPGVGRKTANVILGTCFDRPAIIVDTHVRRVAQRLGFAASEDPEVIEQEIQALLPEDRWTRASNTLTFHGRGSCDARKPDHDGCPVRDLCPSRDL
jgi:endonuclease III